MSSSRRAAPSMRRVGRLQSTSQRRTQPTRQSRTQVASYHEETTSDEATDQQELENSGARRGSHSLRPSSTTNARRSYREQSTDESLYDASEDQNLRNESQPDNDTTNSAPAAAGQESSTAARPVPRAPPRARRRASSRTTIPPPKRPRTKALGQPLKKKAVITPADEITLRSDVIPPWQTLPYHILFDIFLRAFYPLNGPTTQATMASGKEQETKLASTLLGIALLCRGFAEAALAALYYSPPVFSAYNGHGLLKLLSKAPEEMSINYAGKIKELCIDADTVLTLKSGPTLGYFKLEPLLRKTPQLHTLRLYHREDLIFGCPLESMSAAKWSYSNSLFSAINASQVSLRNWEWNGRFVDSSSLLDLIPQMHREPHFQNIRSLRLVHVFDIQEENTEKEDALAAALRDLPALERLEFHECPIVSGAILEKLPLTLRYLTISNCDRVFSLHITNLLKAHGEQLRELNLNHNRHMNMAFIPHLGSYCPNLQRFRVDVSMFDTSSYRDLDPHFLELLHISHKPTWPKSLEEIELYQLRPWDGDVGEMFFESLVEAAPNLKNLRRLDISAMLSGPWRDRARFRDKWFPRLEKIFLRHSPPPDPNLRSLRKRPLASSLPPPRDGGSTHSTPEGNSPPVPSQRQSSRIAQQRIPAAQPEQSNPSGSGTERVDAENIQGMCEHINIRIDNQRPADHQFNECDFLDDELSGDDDYNENGNGSEFEDGYAW